MDFAELICALGLNAEMVETFGIAAHRDGKVDAWIIQHPLRVIVLVHARRLAEQRRIKANAVFKIVDRNVHVKAFHAPLLFRAAPLFTAALAADCGLHLTVVAQEAPAQQFSLR